MHSVRFPLPEGVFFEVPRDYAAYCKGDPVRVVSVERAERDVLTTWDSDTLAFTLGSVRVEYDLSALAGLVVDENEVILGVRKCTLRAAFREPDGEGWGTLPILMTDSSRLGALWSAVSTLRDGGLSVPSFGSWEEFRTAR